ncbi:MAG: hypothetical protein J7K65_03320, partial [Planctomycetes bacterium]|nr:hypothetical protein [Planctomycetota bacterium]
STLALAFFFFSCFSWFSFIGCGSTAPSNTILYFLVFHASFFNAAVVRLYLINGYIKKGKRLTWAAFASLATLALTALFF